jgi:hypothetical protein
VLSAAAAAAGETWESYYHEVIQVEGAVEQDPSTKTAIDGADTFRYSMVLSGGLLRFETVKNPNKHKRGKHDLGESSYGQDPSTNTATAGADTLRYSSVSVAALNILSLVSQGGQDSVLSWE